MEEKLVSSKQDLNEISDVINNKNISRNKKETMNYSKEGNVDEIKEKKEKVIHVEKQFKNPMLTHFNEDSNFIYDITEVDEYISKVENINSLKLNQSEIESLKTKIKILQNEKDKSQNSEFIYINKKLANELDSFIKEKIDTKDELKLFLSKQLQNSSGRINLSVRKLAKKFEEEKGKKIIKSSVHSYLKKIGL